jgi:tetratricopeptide (TPR) repeat protein
MEERMKRWTIAAGLALMLILTGACVKQAPEADIEREWEDFMSAYNELERTDEKVELIEEFLTEHPATRYTGSLAGGLAYYRGDEMDDPEGALAFLDGTLDENTDPETRFEIARAMFPLSAKIGEPMDLATIAEELAAERPLTFGERIDVSDLAVEHGQWTTGATYAQAALEKATPEAFLADYPDDDYTREQAEAKADRRQVMSLANLGWALWNLDRTDEALAAFDRAAPLKTVDYLGVSDTPLDLYRGKAMLDAGNLEEAIDLLTPAAVMGSNEDAMEALRTAHAGTGDGRGEFADLLWSERQRLARPVDDFSLADYDGQMHDFSALSDGKVTLLAFWFPT